MLAKVDHAKRVLVVLHQQHSSPGRIGRILRADGVELDIRRPRYGDPLPTSMARHDGVIVFGGPMSANDPDDYIRDEIDWIAHPLREAKPYLGVCLGAQMLARHLGERVGVHPAGRAEVGYYPIAATPEGQRLRGAALPGHVYQWHREGFDLPRDAVLLARGDDFPHQAFRYGPAAFGLQFHPEVTYALIRRWTTKGEARLALPGARPAVTHIEDWYRYDAAVSDWLEGFLPHWLAGTLDAQATACAQSVMTSAQ